MYKLTNQVPWLFCFLIVTIIKYYGFGYTELSCNDIGEQNLVLAL